MTAEIIPAPVPKRVQIRDYWAGRIARGELAPGDRLPPIRELAERHDVNHNTAAAAVALLAAEKLVTTRGAAGTIVANQQAETGPPRLIFGPQQRLGWVEPIPGERAAVLQATMMTAPAYVAAKLGLQPARAGDNLTPVYRRRQVIYNPAGQPARIETSWFHPRWAEIIPALASETTPVDSFGGAAWAISRASGDPIIAGECAVEARDIFADDAEHREPRPGDAEPGPFEFGWEIPYLAVPPGTGILAGVYSWYVPGPAGGDEPAGVQFMVEYGEFCVRHNQVIELRFTVGTASR
jgi:DNA-binding GntR family transcriptional regulator